MQRRDFLRTGTGAALAAVTPVGPSVLPTVWPPRGRKPARAVAVHPGDSTSATTLRDPRARALAMSAIDAARSAGAHYADVRITNTINRRIECYDPTHPDYRDPSQTVDLGLSVRAFVGGYWGWAATPILSADEAMRVARLAVQFAKQTASRSPSRGVELSPIPVVADGTWMTPIKIDPFELELLELQDWLYGTGRHVSDLAAARGASPSIAWDADSNIHNLFSVTFSKQERLLASTDGSFLVQTVVVTQPNFTIGYRGNPQLQIPQFNQPVQAGWERIVETPVVELFRAAMERADAHDLQKLPTRPLDLGRYDVVFSADAMAQLLSQTLAPATEVDRALGYWANAQGTSYLGPDPLTKLGTMVASPLVTITAERSNPLGLATVKWDDEGVAPEDFTLVKNGVLVDYQTTREQASWLAPWYQQHGLPVRSHGCAMAPSALEEPLQHTPNLVLHPGPGSATEESLVRELEHGVYVPGIFSLEMDWQCSSGMAITGAAVEIKRGNPVSTIGFRAILFDAQGLWKNVQILGGATSATYGNQDTIYPHTPSRKGDPVQSTQFTVGSVPARIQQLAIVDPWKKA